MPLRDGHGQEVEWDREDAEMIGVSVGRFAALGEWRGAGEVSVFAVAVSPAARNGLDD
jgi:hypothetical protein